MINGTGRREPSGPALHTDPALWRLRLPVRSGEPQSQPRMSGGWRLAGMEQVVPVSGNRLLRVGGDGSTRI